MKNRILSGIILLFLLAFSIKQDSKYGEVPKELPKIKGNSTLTWDGIIYDHLYKFKLEIKHRRTITQNMFYACVVKLKVNRDVTKKFYKSHKAQLALYNWLKPYYTEAYKNLPYYKKEIYKNMLYHAIDYMNNFNYEGEFKAFNNNPNSFIYRGANGKRGDFGRMEAFIFRRIHSRDLSLKEMQNWAEVLRKDLEKLE